MARWRFRSLSTVVGAVVMIGMLAGPAAASTPTRATPQRGTLQIAVPQNSAVQGIAAVRSDNPKPRKRGGFYDRGGRNWGHRHGDRYWGPFGRHRGHSHFNYCRSYQGHRCWW